MWKKFEAKLLAVSAKISRNVVLQTLSQSFVNIFPFLMIGSLFSLLSGVPIEAWQNFIKGVGLYDVLVIPAQYTSECISLYIAYMVGYNYCSKKKAKKQAVVAGLTAVFAFLCLNPWTVVEGTKLLSFNYIGSKGLFIAIISSFIVAQMFIIANKRGWKIKMPESVPPYVSNSFSALIPAVIVAFLYIFVNYIFGFTSWGNAMDAFYAMLQAPMKVFQDGPVAMIVLELISQGLWWLGIHGGSVTSPARNGFFMEPRLENLAAYTAGEPLPNLITGHFLSVGVLPLIIVILLFARSKRSRSVGKIAAVPGLFGISEPINFGLPAILNPIFLIPQVFSYALAVLYSYILNVLGWLPYSNGVQIQNVPQFLTAFLRYGWLGVFWWVILLILMCAFIYPFVRMQDKLYLKDEGEDELLEEQLQGE